MPSAELDTNIMDAYVSVLRNDSSLINKVGGTAIPNDQIIPFDDDYKSKTYPLIMVECVDVEGEFFLGPRGIASPAFVTFHIMTPKKMDVKATQAKFIRGLVAGAIGKKAIVDLLNQANNFISVFRNNNPRFDTFEDDSDDEFNDKQIKIEINFEGRN